MQVGGKEKEGEREPALLPYWHIAADPPTCSFSAFFIFAARHARTRGTTPRCIGRTPSAVGNVSSLHAANFARFHATVSHDTVVVNFQLTDDSRSVSEYRCEFTPFSHRPAAYVPRLDIVENHTAYRFFCRVCAFIYGKCEIQ